MANLAFILIFDIYSSKRHFLHYICYAFFADCTRFHVNTYKSYNNGTKPHLPIYSLLIQAEYNAVPYRMCRSMWNVDISHF